MATSTSGLVSADGGEVQRLTSDRRVDVEPAWSREREHHLYFVTARGGNFGHLPSTTSMTGREHLHRGAARPDSAVGIA